MTPQETSVDFNDTFNEINTRGFASTTLHLVMIQHDVDTDLYDTTLVVRSTPATGPSTDMIVCPRPCNIGQAFNPDNS